MFTINDIFTNYEKKSNNKAFAFKSTTFHSNNGKLLFHAVISNNRKIGKNNLSIYIFSTEGNRKIECLDCPLVKNGCYMDLGATYGGRLGAFEYAKNNYKSGKSFHINELPNYVESFKDAISIVRFGAYGEPVLVPYNVVVEVAKKINVVGYTHQWKNPIFQKYKKYFVASCHINDKDNYRIDDANKLGWNTYQVVDYNNIPENIYNDIIDKKYSVCPQTVNNDIQCFNCPIKCNGNGTKNIIGKLNTKKVKTI